MKIKIRYKLPPTVARVERNTRPAVNEGLRDRTVRSLDNYRFCSASNQSARIRQLNSEWDTERVLETNAAALLLCGSLLGWKRGRNWFLFTGLVGGSLLLHALQGWSPAVPLIRKLGVRTSEEINREKSALKLLRGDFALNNYSVYGALAAAEKQ
ncbi:MAG: DUF2892 domain-containing protein [Syntrophomonadaceae bacterium]